MRSLKSSVGSKSSSRYHAGASSFQLNSATQVTAECFVFHQENQSTGLHSSWISRLLPTPAGASIHSPATTSIIRRYLDFGFIKQPLSNISRGGGDGRMAASFGPFKVRETKKSAERVFGKGVCTGGEEGEGRKARILERNMEGEAIGGQISPFVVPFKSRLTRGSARVFEEGIAVVHPVSSSRLLSCFGPWKVESRKKTQVFG